MRNSFEIMGWDAEVMDMKTSLASSNTTNAMRIQRIRFTKPGYMAMDMAMTDMFLSIADEAEIIGMMAEKVARHQKDQDMKRPPGPGYTFDGSAVADAVYFKKEKEMNLSDLVISDDLPDTRSRRQIMEDMMFPEKWINEKGNSARPEVLSPSEQGKVDLTIKEAHGTVKLTNDIMKEGLTAVTYAALISPLILQDLYGEIAGHTDHGPDAEETGEWQI